MGMDVCNLGGGTGARGGHAWEFTVEGSELHAGPFARSVDQPLCVFGQGEYARRWMEADVRPITDGQVVCVMVAFLLGVAIGLGAFFLRGAQL